MRIDNTNSVNFKADLINKLHIGKVINKDKRIYPQTQVSFVKINPFSSKDINALKCCAEYWQYGIFATNVYHAACALRNKSKYYLDHDVFALTSQTSDFDNLNEDSILGLLHVSRNKDNSIFIEHIQTKPHTSLSIVPEFKGIGTGILNSLKLLTDKITCFPARTKSVIDFYERNGFTKDKDVLDCYIWQKPKSTVSQ